MRISCKIGDTEIPVSPSGIPQRCLDYKAATHVIGDHRRLRQGISNFISNSCKSVNHARNIHINVYAKPCITTQLMSAEYSNYQCASKLTAFTQPAILCLFQKDISRKSHDIT